MKGNKCTHIFLINIVKNIGLNIVYLSNMFGGDYSRPFQYKMVMILFKHFKILRCPRITPPLFLVDVQRHPRVVH